MINMSSLQQDESKNFHIDEFACPGTAHLLKLININIESAFYFLILLMPHIRTFYLPRFTRIFLNRLMQLFSQLSRAKASKQNFKSNYIVNNAILTSATFRIFHVKLKKSCLKKFISKKLFLHYFPTFSFNSFLVSKTVIF